MALSYRARRRLEALWAEGKRRAYAHDPAGFMGECVQVPDQNSVTGRTPLVLWDYQAEDLRVFVEERYVVVLKARQLGLTTISMALCLWELLYRPGSNILLVSKDQNTANRALELLDFMWDFLPDHVRATAPKLENRAATMHVWRFPNGMTSRIVSRPATRTAGAGETATRVVWDEAALADDQEETLRTLMPTTDAGGKMVVFSTARGGHNPFAKLYREAKRGENQFRALFHPWHVSRLIDEAQYEAKKAQFRAEPWLFYAEYPASDEEAFRMSGRSRFAGLPEADELEEFPLRGWLREEHGSVRFVEDDRGPLRLRSEGMVVPKWAKCVVSVDPATGAGGDYTAMTAGWVDREGVPQRMAYWHSNEIEPVEAAREANLLGRWFAGSQRAALLVVEKQGGYGDSIIHELAENAGYPNLYVHTYTGHRKRRRDTTYGFPMTATRRPLVIDRLAEWLRFDDDAPVVGGVDPLLRGELGAFVVTDQGRVQADVGMHDDLVMSTAIWLYVLTELVGAATVERVVEDPPTTQAFDLAAMWKGVETARRATSKTNRRELRRTRTRSRR